MTRFEHSGAAATTTLTGQIGPADMSFSVEEPAGYPTGAIGPFWVVLDGGTATEEKILCANRAANVFTVATSGRGGDGTTGVGHAAGATVRHIFTATEADAANAHIEATVAHGANGAIVGTTNTQTLTNKAMSGLANTFSNIPESAITGLSDALDEIADGMTETDEALDTHVADTAAHGATGGVVGRTKTQTLTGKTITSADNTLTIDREDLVTPRIRRWVSAGGSVPAGDTDFLGTVSETTEVGDWGSAGHSSQFIAPETGPYLVTCTIWVDRAVSDQLGYVYLGFRSNSTADVVESGTLSREIVGVLVQGYLRTPSITLTDVVSLSAGTRYHFTVENGTTGTIQLSETSGRSYFSIVRM